MPKTRTTVSLGDEVLRAVKIEAARTGRPEAQVIEESLRRDLGLDDRGEIRAEAAAGERDLRRVIYRRRAAVSRSASEVTRLGFVPSPHEMRAAILIDRN